MSTPRGLVRERRNSDDKTLFDDKLIIVHSPQRVGRGKIHSSLYIPMLQGRS